MAVHSVIILLFTLFGLLMSLTGCKSMKPYDVPLVVAHRGGAGLAPENTLAAFSQALRLGSDMIELDIHLSKDGVMMVMHDPTLERTAGLSGSIDEFDSEVLANIDAAAMHIARERTGFQKIPRLEEVLDLVEAEADVPIGFQIEIKVRKDGSRYPGIEEKLVELLEQRNLIERTIVISFDFPTLETIGRLAPELKRGALVSKAFMTEIGAGGPKAVASRISSLGVEYIGINQNYLTPSLHERLRDQGLGIGVWTVNDQAAMKKFIAMGVDFITSDRPDLLGEVLFIHR